MESKEMLIGEYILSSIDKFINRPMGGVLLCGSKGQGKHMLARRMAVKLLGVDSEDDFKTHPDFREVISQGGVIKMEDLDTVRKSVAYAAVNAERKVFIIDDADLMTANAQNSLLKLLEDMNEKNVVIMVCHGPVLQTVRSRCHVIEFFPQTDECIVNYLKSHNIPVNELAVAIAGGCIGKYFEFCDRKNYLLDVRNFFSVLPRDSSKELLISLSLIKEKDTNNFFEKYSIEDVRAFMNLLFEVFNEMLLRIATGSGMRTRFNGFMDFDTAMQMFSLDEIQYSQKLIKEHLLRTEKKGAYTKNDFFDLIRHI